MRAAELELDLDVFAGPFDLLLTLILREEVDLLEVELADVVLAYLDHLEERGELDLEAATEFLVLIAALLELKSRLMLPGEEGDELPSSSPSEAAEELLARLLDSRRYRGGGRAPARALAAEEGFRFRSAPLPAALRRALARPRRGRSTTPRRSAQAIGGAARDAAARSSCATSSAPRVIGRRAPRAPARAAARAGASASTRPCAAATG